MTPAWRANQPVNEAYFRKEYSRMKTALQQLLDAKPQLTQLLHNYWYLPTIEWVLRQHLRRPNALGMHNAWGQAELYSSTTPLHSSTNDRTQL